MIHNRKRFNFKENARGYIVYVTLNKTLARLLQEQNMNTGCSMDYDFKNGTRTSFYWGWH